MIRELFSAFAVVSLIGGCTQQPTTVEQCLDMASDRNERSQIRYELRYSNYVAYRGVDLYRLYRSELNGGEGRSALATFDSVDGKKYTPDFNKAACELAASGMAAEDPYSRDYWCEQVVGLS